VHGSLPASFWNNLEHNFLKANEPHPHPIKVRPMAKWKERAALQRKRVRPDERVPLELNDRERQLIVEHSFADDDLTGRLRVVPKPNEPPVYRFTLDDWEELAGYVAAEANHAKDKKLRKEWDKLYARLAAVLESYTDEKDGSTD
jgi:hypothetical protein